MELAPNAHYSGGS